jgi:hypothetical protein
MAPTTRRPHGGTPVMLPRMEIKRGESAFVAATAKWSGAPHSTPHLTRKQTRTDTQQTATITI